MGGPSRRAVLFGGAGVGAAVVLGGGALLLDHDELPGSTRIRRRIGWTGGSGHVPDVVAGRVVRGSTRGVSWALVLPRGVVSAGLPVVVALGGRGQSVGYLLHDLGLPRFLSAGHHRFGLLAVAGEDSYYHRRADGSDVGAVVLGPLLGVAAEHGLDVSRPGFLGWSMGGYGVLLLAADRLVGGHPVAAVAATSAAVWPSYAVSAAGAFDSAADFAAHEIDDTRAAALRRIPVRLDCGREDPFYSSDRALVPAVGAVAHYADGAHDAAYWTRVLPAQLRWLDARVAAHGAAGRTASATSPSSTA